MNWGERTALRKKAKELKNELRQLKKELLQAGCDKVTAGTMVSEFGETLETAGSLCVEYKAAKEHLQSSQQKISNLLLQMGKVPETEVTVAVAELLAELRQVYHDCLIREEDLDFSSTMKGLEQMLADRKSNCLQEHLNGMQELMLRSELENLKAILDEAGEWQQPDFMALSYYVRHEDKSSLGDMENTQRNLFMADYYRKNFMESFTQACEQADLLETIRTLEQQYLQEEEA